MYEVYLITNLLNGKHYVGQTKNGFAFRWQEHLQEANAKQTNRLLYNALRKHGSENFEVSVLEKDIPQELIDEREKFYISEYKSYFETGLGYNMTLGGQGVHGYKHTDSEKLKISEGTKAAWEDLKANQPNKYRQLCEHRSKIAKGKPKSLEHRQKLSQAASQRVGDKNPFYGKHFTEESKEKLRAAWDKRVPTVQATNIETGESLVYRSVSEAVRALKLNQSAISRITLVCKEGKGKAYNHYWCYVRKEGDE